MYDFRNRAYHPGLGRFMQSDPIGLQGKDFNFYRYVLNSPARWVDPFGLEVRVYSDSTFGGVGGAQHVFVWSTEAKTGVGRSGKYGLAILGDGVPNGFDSSTSQLPYKAVTDDLNGMTEAEFIEYIKQHINDAWWYEPGRNDCHSALEDAFMAAEVDYPGSPFGRTDWNEGVSRNWEGLKQSVGSKGNSK